MATPFIVTLKPSGGDIDDPVDFDPTFAVDLTATTTKTIPLSGVVGGTLAKTDAVTGAISGATGTVHAVNAAGDQILLTSVSGTFNTSEKIEKDGATSNYVTTDGAQDRASFELHCYRKENGWTAGTGLHVLQVSNFVCDITHHILVTVPEPERTNFRDKEYGCFFHTSSAHEAALYITNEFTKVEYLSAYHDINQGAAFFGGNAGNDFSVWFESCFASGTFVSSLSYGGFYLSKHNIATNCIARDCAWGINAYDTHDASHVHNCLAINCTVGIRYSGGSADSNYSRTFIRNSVAIDCTDGFWTDSSTLNNDSGYNASDDSSHPDPNTNGQDIDSTDFVDYANDDYRITDSSTFFENGVNMDTYDPGTEDYRWLENGFNSAINGTRGTTWDIGPHVAIPSGISMIDSGYVVAVDSIASRAITLTTTPADGDLLVLQEEQHRADRAPPDSVEANDSASKPFTNKHQGAATLNGDIAPGIWYRACDGTETTIQIEYPGSARFTGIWAIYRGVDGTTPFADDSETDNGSSPQTSISTGTVTATADNSLALYFFAGANASLWGNGTNDVFLSASAGYHRLNIDTSSVYGCMALYDEFCDDTDDVSCTFSTNGSGGDCYAVTLILNPDTGGGDHSITGASSISLTPAASMAYTAAHDIAGDVTITLTPAASMAYASAASISGDVTWTVTPAATMAYAAAHAIAGDVTWSITPAASMQYATAGGIIGDVTWTVTPAASMAYSSGSSITGDVTITLVPAGQMAYNRHYLIAGASEVRFDIAAAMQYATAGGIVGNVTWSITPAATMAYAAAHAIAGDSAITLTPAATMVYRKPGEAAIAGDVTWTITPAAIMEFGSLLSPTPESRTFIVGAENRCFIIPEENRTFTVYN